jgi:hypothetical protein
LRYSSRIGVALWIIVAAAPVAAGLAAIRGGWTATSDWAMIAARSLETLSWDPPLTGMPTSLSLHSDDALFHPGPLPFWIFAAPTRVLGEPGYGLIVGASAVNVAAIAASFVLFRRSRVLALVLGGAVLVALLEVAAGATMLRDPFNPSVAVLPMFALLVATWSVLDGHPKAMIVLVTFGSIAAQAHVMNLPTFALLVGVAFASLLATAVQHRHGGGGHAALRWSATSAGLLVLCWSGPLVDQVAGHGNLVRLLTNGSSVDGSGLRYGAERMVQMITQLPWARFSGGPQPDPDLALVEVALGVAMLLVVAATGVWAAKTGRRSLAAWQATALLGCGGAVLTTARVPVSSFGGTSSPASVLIWLPVGAVLRFAVLWGMGAAVASLAPRLRLEVQWSSSTDVAVSAAAATAVIAAALSLGPLRPNGDPGSITWGAARVHAAAIARELPPGRTVLLDTDGSPGTTPFIPTLIGQLRLRGVEVLYAKRLPETGMFPQYHETGNEPPAELMTALIRAGDGADEPLDGHRLISSYDPAEPIRRYAGYDRRSAFGFGGEPTAVYVIGGA